MRKKAPYKSAKEYINKVLKDPEIRILYEEEKIKTDIAYAVKVARKKADLTQEELADLIGTTQSAIARLESGVDERTPSLSLLARIACACGAHFSLNFNFSKDS